MLPPRARQDAMFCSSACRARFWRWTQLVSKNVAAVKDSSPAARAECPECGTVWGGGSGSSGGGGLLLAAV